MYIGPSNQHLVKRIDKDGHRSFYTEEEAKKKQQEYWKKYYASHPRTDEQRERRRLKQIEYRKRKYVQDQIKEQNKKYREEHREDIKEYHKKQREKLIQERLDKGLPADLRTIKKCKPENQKKKTIKKEKSKRKIIHKTSKVTISIIKKPVKKIVDKIKPLTQEQENQKKLYGRVLSTIPDSNGFFEYKRYTIKDSNCFNCKNIEKKVDLNTMKVEYYCPILKRNVFMFSYCPKQSK